MLTPFALGLGITKTGHRKKILHWIAHHNPVSDEIDDKPSLQSNQQPPSTQPQVRETSNSVEAREKQHQKAEADEERIIKPEERDHNPPPQPQQPQSTPQHSVSHTPPSTATIIHIEEPQHNHHHHSHNEHNTGDHERHEKPNKEQQSLPAPASTDVESLASQKRASRSEKREQEDAQSAEEQARNPLRSRAVSFKGDLPTQPDEEGTGSSPCLFLSNSSKNFF